jgi:rubrerythrin
MLRLRNRKADRASHNEETARLNRELVLEEENRKDENKKLMAETKQLKATITKEREERKAEVAVLERSNEQQGARLEECERELRKAKKQHDNDMQFILEVCTTILCSFFSLHRGLSYLCPFQLTQKLVPIHLRILLEYTRRKISTSLGYTVAGMNSAEVQTLLS